MPYIKTEDGYNVHYGRHNLDKDTPCLFFLHGWMANWTNLKPEIGHFRKKGYRIIYMDMRGHGKSDVPKDKEGFHLENIAADMKHIMDKLSVEKVIPIGYSMGGMVSLLFALSFKEVIEGMILLDSSYKGPDYFKVGKFEFDVKRLDPLSKKLAKSIHKEHYKKDIVDLSRYESTSEGSLIIDRIRHMHLPNVFYYSDEMFNLDLSNRLKEIIKPALVIGSGDDQFFSYETEKKMSELLPNASLEMLFGDHLDVLAEPSIFSQKIEAFIEKLYK
ncbi:MAG: alpha/beta fold hydrolase [Nanobdellota archaeon]